MTSLSCAAGAIGRPATSSICASTPAEILARAGSEGKRACRLDQSISISFRRASRPSDPGLCNK
ncbi:MAG: hypothetical protein ACREWI_07670, partial [Telluria sp.]